MKNKKTVNRIANTFSKLPPNVKFYLTIAAIACGMAGMFFLGYGLLSLFDRGRSEYTSDRSPNPPVLVPSPPVTATAPTQNQPSVPLPNQSSVPLENQPSTPATTKPTVPSKQQPDTYQVIGQTNFKKPSAKLESVVNRIVKYSKDKNLPLQALSISLIDTQTGERADYQGNVHRYPASVVKMFWLVAAYQKIDKGEIDGNVLRPAIEQMIYKSDNQGASQVIDAITQTKSNSDKLSATELSIAKQQRQQLNAFFSQAGYSQDINVSQKTFPIPQEKIMEPQGFDRQLRGDNLQRPIRNKLTTNDAARLMSEIVNARSISLEASKKMRGLLGRNVDPGFWKKQPPNPIDFNPVESFFGEGLPVGKTENIVSKAGWTSASRQEVAFIKSKDGKTRYVLAIFGDDDAYSKNKKIFPEISKLVYSQMRQLSK